MLKALIRQVVRPSKEEFQKISVPILIINGKHDLVTLPSNGDLLVSWNPAFTKHVILENSAHMTMLEEPDRVNPMVLDFYQSEK
jgi:pimeloyl-ACP methyl ester carboxylesterase